MAVAEQALGMRPVDLLWTILGSDLEIQERLSEEFGFRRAEQLNTSRDELRDNFGELRRLLVADKQATDYLDRIAKNMHRINCQSLSIISAEREYCVRENLSIYELLLKHLERKNSS